MNIRNSFSICSQKLSRNDCDLHDNSSGTDRELAFKGSKFAVHEAILGGVSPVLGKIFKENTQYLVSLDELVESQPCLTKNGVEKAIDFIYGKEVKIEYNMIPDAMAAAHVLMLPEMVALLEDEVIKMTEHPLTALTALEHATQGNLSEDNTETVLLNCAVLLPELTVTPSFIAATSQAFTNLIMFCVRRVEINDPITTTFDILHAAFVWTEMNRKNDSQLRRLITLVPAIETLTLSNLRFLSEKAANTRLKTHGELLAQRVLHEVLDDCLPVSQDDDGIGSTPRLAAGTDVESTCSYYSSFTADEDYGTTQSFVSDDAVSQGLKRAAAGGGTGGVDSWEASPASSSSSNNHSIYLKDGTDSQSGSLMVGGQEFCIDLGTLPPSQDGTYVVEVTMKKINNELVMDRVLNFDLDLEVGN